MKNIFLSVGFMVLELMLTGCSTKEKIVGDRENIILPSEMNEGEVEFDHSPVILDEPQYNKSFSQSFMTSQKSYGPIAFPFIGREIWSANVGYESGNSLKITSSPIVAEGKVFCIDAAGIVHALDSKTGKKIWSSSTTIIDKDGQIGGALAYENGKLIVTSSFSECFAMDAKNGKVIWRIKLPAPCKGDGITIYEGMAFVSCSNSSLQVIDIENGKTIWSHTGMVADSTYIGSSGVAIGDGLVFVAYPSGEIYALLLVTGEPVWDGMITKTSLTDASRAFSHPRACPVYKDGFVYFSSANGQTCAFSAKTGAKVWQRNYGSVQTPIVSGNSIFIFNEKSEIVCLNTKNGNPRWITMIDKNTSDIRDWYGMILIDQGLAMFSPNGRVVIVSPHDGKIQAIKSVNLGFDGNVSLNPVIADSILYVLSDSARLSAYK